MNEAVHIVKMLLWMAIMCIVIPCVFVYWTVDYLDLYLQDRQREKVKP